MPSWAELIRIWKEHEWKCSKDYVYKELQKMAKVMDILKDANNEESIIIYDGVTKEMHKMTGKSADEIRKVI